MKQLEKEILKIKERNRGVEADKAWETSFTRRVLIAVFTYAILGGYMWAIGVSAWWLHALVPTTGFVLSTLAMPWFKKRWIRRFLN